MVVKCVTGSGECEKMKGFQMHLFAHRASSVFFYITCSKVMYILLFLFVLVVYAHTVRTYLCPLSCIIGIFTCVCS